MFSCLIIFLVLHGSLTIVIAICDTTHIYSLHHDYDHYKLYLTKVDPADLCRPHSYCPTLDDGFVKQFNCGYGFYNNKRDSTSSDDCLPCPAGKFCMGALKDCTPGYYCPADGLPKEPWPGYYAPDVGMTEPMECPAGKYQNHIQHIKWNWRGISTCTTCPEFMFCDTTKLTQPAGYCDDGWYCGDGEMSARPTGQYCQPGEYCISGRKFTCEEGTFQPLGYMHECFECPEGEYCAGTGLSAPSGSCDAGWYCGRRETSSQPTGKICPAGYMCPDGMLTPCGKGYYQPNTGQSTCIPCPVGKYCGSIGLINPTGDCDPGCCQEIAQIIKSSCPIGIPTACSQGYYEDSGVCTLCTVGMYCALSGLSAPSGTCEPGWYCETGEITPTPLGKLCPAGYKCSAGVKTPCSSAVRETEPYLGQVQYFYQPERGQTKCVVCPDRYDCAETALTRKKRVCDPGYKCHLGLVLECEVEHFCYGGEMLPCRDGFTTNQKGQDECVRCNDNELCENGKVLPCPDNMVCFNGHAEYCELGYECSYVSGNVKTPCAPGTERYEVESATCVTCREFRYCRSASSYECFRYMYGLRCDAGADKPFLKMSQPGHYFSESYESYDTNRGYIIEPCPIGKYQDKSHRAYCWLCPAGKYCNTQGLLAPVGTCTSGYYCAKGSVFPTSKECSEGHFCIAGSGNEEACPAGTYQPSAAQSTCITCPTGYFCNDTKLLSPAGICPAGSKCPEGTIFPVPCVANTHQYETGKEICICDDGYYCQNIDEDPTACPVGHFCVANTKSACPEGKYQSKIGSANCSLCEAGTFQNSPGSGSCVPCAVGTFQQDEGQTFCDDCIAGTYQPNEGGVVCSQCNPGTFQISVGSSDCNNCLAGSYQPDSGSTSCLPCPAGRYQPNEGGSSCPPCNAGTFQINAGSSVCDKCVAGRYQPDVGSTSCLKCAVGKYQPNEGRAECLPCASGTYQSGEGSVGCDQCAAGEYQPNEGSVSCIRCAVGTKQPNQGMTACILCDPGTFQTNEGSTSCNDCFEGTFQSDSGSTSCVPCPFGTFQPDTGMEDCIYCSVGTYQDSIGMTGCLPCAEGTYQSTQGGETCIECEPGTYQPSQGNSYCIQCSVGNFQSNSGSTVCDICPVGTFGPDNGMAECQQCTPGMYCESIGLSIETNYCWKGHECPEGSIKPFPCQSGFFNADDGQSACTICVVGYYCNQTEAEIEQQSGMDKATHGVVVPKQCPFFIYCGPGAVAPVCDYDYTSDGVMNVVISCKPSCRTKMTPFGDLKFRASCDNCGNMVYDYQWSVRQCIGPDIQDCRHCVGHVTYLTEYTGNSAVYNQAEHSPNNTDWTYFGIVVKVRRPVSSTLQNDTIFGMAYFIWEYIQMSEVQCEILPVTGAALITDFNITCSDPELPAGIDYMCSMFYAYTSVGDTIIYKMNETCNETGVILRQGDKNKSFRQHLKVVGKHFDHILWDVPLLLMVDLPPMTAESIDGFIGTVGGALSESSNDKEIVESLNKLQGLTYVLNEVVINQTESDDGDGDGDEPGENKGTNDKDILEQKKENMKIRDTIVTTISQVNTTSIEVMGSVAATLNQITLKKDELSPETKEKTYEMYNSFTEQFQQMENTTLDEEVTDAAKTLLFGVISIIDIVTDEIKLEDSTQADDDENQGTTVSSTKVITTTPSAVQKEERERVMQKVKERTEKLLKSVENIADIVLTRQEVDSEPTTVQTPTMSISMAKVSPENLVGKPIKTDTGGDDKTSLTLPEDLELSDDIGSVGTEFVYIKKNPYVWADNSENIQPPIVSIKLKDSDNNVLNISNLSSPVRVNLASDGGALVGQVPVLLTFYKDNSTTTMTPSQRRPCAATFEVTVERDRAVAFTLSLPNNLTSMLLSVRVDTKFDVYRTIAAGFRYPEDIHIIRHFYGKLSESDEETFDNTTGYCQTCAENCCNTTENCEGIYKHCVYYCNRIIKHPCSAGCLETASPAVYCQTCQSQCCDGLKNCTGILENCVIFCDIYFENNITTECLEYVDSVAEMYTNLTENVTSYCQDCQKMCCNESETCSGIYANCVYFCENIVSESITTLCKNQITSSVETIYLFPRSHLTKNETTHQIYLGLSIDPTNKQVIQDLINMEPRCLGNTSLEACLVDFDLTIPLRLSKMKCEYWDESNQRWSTTGLEVSKESGGDTLQCISNHLTSFSKSVLVAPSFIDPIDVKLFLTFFENPVVVTVVIVVWMIYFFLIHWARQKDKSDTEQVGVIYCADNVATHTYTYLVCIVTGWWSQAGTTANVYIYLKGTMEISPRKCLKTPVRKCFQTGYEDWFLLTTEYTLGDIKSVTLWHDNTGSSPHWYVNQVYVKDMQKNSSWTFVYNDWLAADRGNLLMTTTTLLPVTEEELKFKKKYNFMIKSTQDLRDGHIWISIFSKPASSPFTRVQRLTCCLTLLLTTMLTNIMFYGIPTDDPEDQLVTGGFKLSLSQIVIGIESSLIMFPVNLLIVQLFLKVKPKPQEVDYSEPKPVEYFLEIIFGSKWQAVMAEIDRNLLELTNIRDPEGMKVFTRVPRPSKDLILESVSSEISKKNDGKILPWWFVYIAWVISILTCMTSSYFVMLYGLKYGYTRSVEWLVSFFTGFFQSIFVQQPLKVIGLAVVLTLIFKKTPKFDDSVPDQDQDKDEEYLHSVCITPPETHQLVMEPLPKRLLDKIRNRLRVEWLMDVTLRDMVFHILYLTVVLVMVHGHRNINQAFHNTQTVRTMFVNPSQGIHLEQVSKGDDFYAYLQATVVPAMLDITADHETASLGSNHYLVGTYRLRQLRMKQNVCRPPRYSLPLDCKEPYWMGGEDTQSYNQSWSQPLPANTEMLYPDHWVRRSAWELQTLPYPGAHATYSGGGYVVDLPVNVTDHPAIFSNLLSSQWIDAYTRAVFLEFTLYNPNVDLFTVAVYLFEFTNVGRVFPMHNEFTSSLYHYSTDYQIMIACCEVMFFCFNVAFIYVEIKKLRQNGKSHYFSDFWSYIEIFEIALAIALFGLFIKRISSVHDVIHEFKISKGQYFVNFYSAMFWDFVFGYVSASLIGLVTLKSVKHLRFNKRTKLISTTLGVIKPVFVGYVLMFALTTIAFAHISYMMFGSSMEDFQTFGDSWVAIIIILMGEADYVGLQNSYRFFGPLFICAVILICQYGLMVMMTTILNIGRLEAKFKLMKKKSKFELLKYIGSKVKLVLNIK